MKVAQNDETNPSTQSVYPPHIPSIVNTQLSPFNPAVQKRENTGDIFPDVSPPSPVSAHTALGHP